MASLQKILGKFPVKAYFYYPETEIYKCPEKWLAEGYKKIIVPSNILKAELENNFGISDDKFVVIYPGVDVPETFIAADSHASNAASGLVAENDKNLNEFVFGLSAPSFSKKGGNIFLKSLSMLKKKGYKFKAKIIYPKARKNLSLQFSLFRHGLRDSVEFFPYQKDMQGFYNSVDAVVMPSLIETFGLVALEGMANGKPAVVSSNCGASEIIQDGF